MTSEQLYQQFQHRFPFETLKDMTLDEYTNLDKKDSFCYWLEYKTDKLGSIKGGSSYKFGIYMYDQTQNKDNQYKQQGPYTWYAKLGSTAKEAYKNVLEEVCKIASFAKNGYFDKIDTCTLLWPMVRWKIAFLYSQEKLLPIYNISMLKEVAKHYGIKGATSMSQYKLNEKIMEQKGNKSVFDFYEHDLLPIIDKKKSEKEKDTTVKKYWWLTASPKIWSLSNMKVDEEQEYTVINENGHPRRILQNFKNAKKGDLVIGYEATPTLSIVAICEISKDTDEKYLYFKKKESLSVPIQYSEFKEVPELKNMEWMKNKNGSLFKLTKNEFDVLMDIIREQNPLETNTKHVPYNKEDFLNEVFLEENDYDRLRALLLSKKNVILEGAPGVGKTFAARRLAYSIIGEKDENRIAFVQFHQSYSYEDFMMGYKPDNNGGFQLKPGAFYTFCKRAQNHPDKPYFFIIDEINRGNVSKIFGELLMLIEKEHRDEEIRLAYSDELFSVPNNLYIIGMMNTADRSLAMIDYALRRRFSFYDIKPAFDSKGFKKYQKKLGNATLDKVIDGIKQLNYTIANDDSLGSGFCIGHSYFCGQKDFSPIWLENVVEYDVLPMLREYWFDNENKYKEEAEKLRSLLK